MLLSREATGIPRISYLPFMFAIKGILGGTFKPAFFFFFFNDVCSERVVISDKFSFPEVRKNQNGCLLQWNLLRKSKSRCRGGQLAFMQRSPRLDLRIMSSCHVIHLTSDYVYMLTDLKPIFVQDGSVFKSKEVLLCLPFML